VGGERGGIEKEPRPYCTGVNVVRLLGGTSKNSGLSQGEKDYSVDEVGDDVWILLKGGVLRAGHHCVLVFESYSNSNRKQGIFSCFRKGRGR